MDVSIMIAGNVFDPLTPARRFSDWSVHSTDSLLPTPSSHIKASHVPMRRTHMTCCMNQRHCVIVGWFREGSDTFLNMHADDVMKRKRMV